MPYLYLTEEDKREMLSFLGLDSEDALFDRIPEDLRLREPLPLPTGLGEPETVRKFTALSGMNREASGLVSFLGGGIYDHVVPAVVSNLTSRPEFATAYTPYQPEVSQGTLQVIFEFQTHIAKLTGMPVANASMYDGATALAEASLMAAKTTRRSLVLHAASVNPRYLRVVERYLRGQHIELAPIPHGETGDVDEAALRSALSDRVAGVIVQTPNYFGALEKPWSYEAAVHEAGALLIAAVDPVSLSLFREPGTYNADIVVGEGQSLGNAMNFGGPLLGFIACRDKLIRQMPGRIVSATKDVDGNDAFVLTLQTREQHIRREKATSNICTNQGLLATRATIYLSLIGEQGFNQLGRLCYDRGHRLAHMIEECDGYSLQFEAPFFREFVVECPVPAADVVREARRDDVLAGIALEKYFGEGARNQLLVAVTEKHAEEDFERLCRALVRAAGR
jgi:glycine dehydrogenase subunit 1